MDKNPRIPIFALFAFCSDRHFASGKDIVGIQQ
jgi:hypothetical protein